MDASTWATIEEIFRDLLIFVAFMIVLLVALVVIISMLPADNPLKRTLIVVYDIGAPILLLWYWYTFFRNMVRNKSEAPVQQIARDRR
jgi:hypothetical protein